MAVETRRITIGQARARRQRLAQYLRIDDSRYLIAAAAVLCLMSMLYLGQTGIVATKGYELTHLRTEQTELMRQQADLRTRLAAAQDLEQITRRAESQLGLRPHSQEQVRYIVIAPQPGGAATP